MNALSLRGDGPQSWVLGHVDLPGGDDTVKLAPKHYRVLPGFSFPSRVYRGAL